MKKAQTNKVRFFTSIIILFSFTVFITNSTRLLKKPSSTFVVEKGDISYEETSSGYLIRDEVVLEEGSKESEIIPIKYEGEKVSKRRLGF
ncbi:MAG: hypothetical protein IKM97_03295 [Clostridia bacterium]|nr:hypothetical protein [Clostridia bacterium]